MGSSVELLTVKKSLNEKECIRNMFEEHSACLEAHCYPFYIKTEVNQKHSQINTFLIE